MEAVNSVPAAAEDLAYESSTRALTGAAAAVAVTLSVAISAYAIYWVVGVVQPQVYRITFLLLALALSFVLYPRGRSDRARVSWFDWGLIVVTVLALLWPIVDFDRFIYR